MALLDVKTTLQSIGEAVVGRRVQLKAHAPRNKYSPIKASVVTQAPVTQVKEKKEMLTSLAGSSKLLRAIIEDTEVSADRKLNAVLALLG